MYQAELASAQAARNGTLSMTTGLSQVQMDFSPGVGVWSVGEILDHLLLTDQIYRHEIAQLIDLARTGRRPFVSRTLVDFNISPAFIPRPLLPFSELPFRMFNLFMPRPVREFMFRYRLVPARNADIANPRKGRNISDLRGELESSIKQTTELLNANPGLNYRKLVFDHPLLGANNVLELLRILAAHELRHQDQIREILQQVRH